MADLVTISILGINLALKWKTVSPCNKKVFCMFNLLLFISRTFEFIFSFLWNYYVSFNLLSQ